MDKNYWLMKSEPDVWSIEQQKKAGNKGAVWDGVRNYQAANNLKAMKVGDLCFFYHSNIGKEIKSLAMEQGLFIRPLGNVIYLLPPLCITDDQLGKSYWIIRQTLDNL